MNFIPKSVFRFKDSQGNITTGNEYNFGDIGAGNYEFIEPLIISLIFAIIASPILLIISIITYSGRVQVTNILGLIIGSYYLIDCYNDWYISGFTLLWFNVQHITFIICMTVASIMAHFGMLLLSIFKPNINNTNTIVPIGVIWVFIFFIGFQIGNTFSPNIGKDSINKANDIEILDYGHWYAKQYDEK